MKSWTYLRDLATTLDNLNLFDDAKRVRVIAQEFEDAPRYARVGDELIPYDREGKLARYPKSNYFSDE